MPNELSEAALDAGQQTEATTPETTTDEVSSQHTEQPQDKPLTHDDVRQMIQEQSTRIAQSLVAKGETRINTRIQEQLKALNLNKAALGLSDDQVAQAKQKIIADAYDQPAEDVQEPTPPPPPADPAAAVDNFLNGIFEEAGAKVTTNDPEWKELQKVLDDNFNNPNGLPKVLVAATKAAEAKRNRTASLQETAAARVGGSGSHATGTVLEGNGRQQLSQAFGSK